MKKRIYYRHFFQEDTKVLFDEEEIIKRVYAAAKVIPILEEKLTHVRMKEGDRKRKGNKWIVDPQKGDFASYVPNQIVSVYIQGSYLWGMGSKPNEEGQIDFIPPGDMDFIVVVDSSELLFEVYDHVDFTVKQILEPGERGYDSVSHMDITIVSTGFLEDRFRNPTPRAMGRKEDASTTASLLNSIWGSALVLKGVDFAKSYHPGYSRLMNSSLELYKNSKNRLKRGEVRKAVNRMLESLLITYEAVQDWNHTHPYLALEFQNPGHMDLESLFEALTEALTQKEIEEEAEEKKHKKNHQKGRNHQTNQKQGKKKSSPLDESQVKEELEKIYADFDNFVTTWKKQMALYEFLYRSFADLWEKKTEPSKGTLSLPLDAQGVRQIDEAA